LQPMKNPAVQFIFPHSCIFITIFCSKTETNLQLWSLSLS
jgi:hypothetical protein